MTHLLILRRAGEEIGAARLPFPATLAAIYASMRAILPQVYVRIKPTTTEIAGPWVCADSPRVRREAATERPCIVVPMATWHHDAGAALHRAERERLGTQ
jgi:hypothetical protein